MNKKNPLVNMKEMLERARLFHYAVAQININNLEWTKAVLTAANETKTPIILGVSEGAIKHMWGYTTVAEMVKAMVVEANIDVPVCLHLDHGSYDGCIKALEAGFSSIMYDGSRLPLSENIENTKKIVELARKYNASVEAEIGGFDAGNKGNLANLNDCLEIAKLPIDALAFAFGSIHGIYPADWTGLDFNLLKEFTSMSDVPVVLHGGSGIDDQQIKLAISLGVCKINVNTECQLAFASATRNYITNNCDLDLANKGYDPRKLLKPGIEAIKAVCVEKFSLFGSFGVNK